MTIVAWIDWFCTEYWDVAFCASISLVAIILMLVIIYREDNKHM